MTEVITAWIIVISATINGAGTVGASSLPQSWPTEEACLKEAAEAKAYIEHTRPDLTNLEVRCVPHRKLQEM